MARVTIEDCLSNVENRFALVHLTADRVRQLMNGAYPLVDCDNKDVVTALREIGKGKVLANVVVKEAEEESNLKIDIPDIL